MSNDFDQFPIYDPIVKSGSNQLSDIWVSAISIFYQNLIAYLSGSGVFLPHLTTTQRDAIKSPVLGQMIYNTTVGSAQYWKAGSPDNWSSF